MKIGLFAVCLCAVLLSAIPGNAQQVATWTNATPGNTPVIANINGGPWTLAQGGPYTQVAGATTSGGPVSGTTPYCNMGTPILNSPSTQNPMQPFYTPFTSGRGAALQGYFDYRPRNVDEAVVAAISPDGGNTWNFEQQVENLTTACPTTDANKSGNDDGLGHPFVVNFAGAGFVYMLDRRNGHVDFDGLIVHTLTPKAGLPLNGQPASIEVGNIPPTSETITRWDFSNYPPAGVLTNSPLPSIGTGTATSLGMTNSYSYVVTSSKGKMTTYVGSVTADDLTNTTGGTDPNPAALAWRIRGTKGNDGPNTGDGWNTAAPQYSQGAQFMVSTVGYYNIVFQYDWYTTSDGVRNLQAQYTTDGSTWTNVGPVQVAQSGGGYSDQITINFPALGITAVNNNPNFGVQLVSAYDPTYTGTGAPTYTQATPGTNAPVVINNTSGNWRFDEINVLGTASITSKIPTAPETTGLINPDGILAQVPNVYPLKVLYISKTLNADFAFPVAQQCGLSSSGGAANHDTSYVRIATSTDSIHWTDLGPVTGLNDPTTVSLHSVRYVAPNGSLVKLPNGNWGLFFGGGNCLDGDSDAFHAIMYAESSNLTSWTIYNGIDNPIASVAPTTDPSTGATIPLNTPVLGATQPWFTGRVYGPQATWANSSTINLNFSGYDATYSADISDYRTIGHAVLSTSTTTLP
jgi:hypothetical protein